MVAEITQEKESITQRIAELSPEKRELLKRLLMNEEAANTHRPILPRHTTSRTLPLSFAQQRLWFLDQLEPDSSIYNIYPALSLSEPLNLPALELSLNEIVRRHETLRTTFTTIDGHPFQLIAPSLSLSLPVIDLRPLSQSEREAQAQRIAQEEARRPFDLSRGPLLRATLLRLDETESVLLLTMHHIVTDGWSMGVLFHELRTLYQAFSEGRESPLPELPVQYADYAIWQRQWLTGDVLDKQLAYWRKQLADLPVLQLPTDHARPAVPSFRGASHYLALPESVTEGLKALSQREGVTLFMTLLAAFQCLLQRYSGQEEIVVGSPIAGRNRAEIEGLIGFFVNTLVLRTEFSGEPSFREVLRRVREVCLGAYAHQDVPFEKLVEELQPNRDLSRNPLFQVMFQLLKVSTPFVKTKGKILGAKDVERGTAVFDLAFDVWESPGGISGQLEYSTDLFKATTIARLAEHFQTLLAGIVADPDQKVSHLPLLTDSERQLLLYEWNRTDADSPTSESPSEATVHQLFEQQAERRPDDVAAVFGDEQVSYRELNERANQVARYLRGQGVSREELVGLCVERSVEMVVGMLGIMKAGGGYVPIDVEYPVQRVQYMVEDAALRVVLTSQALRERFQFSDTGTSPPRLICLDTEWELIAEESVKNVASDVSGENLAYVIYTSGSTGGPKGVLITHQALLNHNFAVAREFNLKSSDRVLQFASLSFDVAAEEMFPSWLSGATVVFRPASLVPSIPDFLQELESARVTVVNIPTPYWHEWVQTLSEADASWPSSLRLVVVGSERASPEYFAIWREKVGPRLPLINAYGPTETTITALLYQLPSKPEEQLSLTELPIGRPIRKTEVYVLDQHLQPLPIGLPGLLFIGGCGLARGYLNRPDLTAHSFIPHPFSSTPGARLYRSGDRVRYREDGTLEFLGREDQQVKVRGYRIELGEIEAVLEQMEGVQRAVVEVINEEGRAEKRLVAYLVAEQQHERERVSNGDVEGEEQKRLSNAEVRRYLRERLPEYMIPAVIVWMEQMPLTPNGKLDRRALPAVEAVRPEMETAYVAPRSRMERVIAGVWQEVLAVERVGLHDNFFDLGGRSLLLVRVHSKLRETLKRHISMMDLFRHPTVSSLAKFLSREQDEQMSFKEINDRAKKQKQSVSRRRSVEKSRG